jgi:fatty-acyl-CoA synthase
VPERAAVPVRIEVVPQMPVTAVGKIAKAELRMRAAEHVFTRILGEHGIEAGVSVRAEVKRGTVAQVSCAASQHERVLELLGRFSLPVDFVRAV